MTPRRLDWRHDSVGGLVEIFASDQVDRMGSPVYYMVSCDDGPLAHLHFSAAGEDTGLTEEALLEIVRDRIAGSGEPTPAPIRAAIEYVRAWRRRAETAASQREARSHA